ncbi:MAG: hypothetical protein ACREOO_02105 [bacterium]
MRKKLILAAVCTGVIGLLDARAQQPAPPIDHTPLARPRPAGVFQTNDVQKLLRMISDSVQHAGYKVNSFDVREAALEATKPDDAQSKNYDKVIIWLERDVQEPAKFVKLYMLYGRYEYLLAQRRDVYRIQIDQTFEQARVGKLKESLLMLRME